MTVVPPGPEGWRPVRGDYGKEYLSEIVDLIEERNCAKGCRKNAGDLISWCDVLAGVIAEKPVPEIDPRPDGPVCTVREPIDGGGE